MRSRAEAAELLLLRQLQEGLQASEAAVMTLRMMALRIPRLVGNSTFDVPRFMRGSEPRIRSFKPRESVGRPVTGRYLGSNAQPSAKTPQNTPPPFGPRDAGPFSWRMLAVFLGVGTGGLAYYSLEKQRRLKGNIQSRATPISSTNFVAPSCL